MAKCDGLPVRIGFLGLFECVASVGLADSARRAAGLPMADGHFAWAAEVRKTLPPEVRRVVHMLAAHEQRLNFPLTRIQADCPHTEIVYPGMHSDVGGGYGLGTQGRSPSDGELLSQAALLHMHKAARIAGVPLLDPLRMRGDLLKDYALDKDLAASWNFYMRQASADHLAEQTSRGTGLPAPLQDCRSHDALVRLHMRLYYDFRRAHLGPTPGNRPGFWIWPKASPNAQEREDIDSYNALLLGDVRRLGSIKPDLPCNHLLGEMLARRPPMPPAMPHPSQRQLPRQLMRAQDQEWMAWALDVMQGKRRVDGDGHYYLIGRYMHDSLAGFYLLGYTTREEKSETLLALVEKKARGEALNAHEAEVVTNYNRISPTNAAVKKAIQKRIDDKNDIENAQYADLTAVLKAREEYARTGVFDTDENRAIDESGIFPVLKDGDAEE
ncbi:MAG: hypothetical protein EON92_17060, partial [Burkholderiales bacterium]